jgi:hypothetical protein
MNLYNQLAIVIILAGLSFLSLIWFAKIQREIDTFWQEKFKPNFLMFPANEVKITKAEMEKIHLLYQELSIATGFFAMFFVLFICELIELYRSYMKRNLASVAS